MFCGGDADTRQKADNEVYINVYDISKVINNTLGHIGLGVFHTGVEVYGEEYGFGRCTDGIGVYKLKPTTYEGHTYKESLLVGSTNHDQSEVESIVSELCYSSWYGNNKYHLINMNCNDFSECLTRRLLHTNDAFPLWVNRPCRMAAYLLPEIVTEKVNSFDEFVFLKHVSENALRDIVDDS
eukprot:TRINITY_DN2725_c3_g1_i1.p1 TRINITY_DN2725_c3_g1~~TRINITY_DN2725_c3_g1_i1.p1  ORF type:complete len:182 (+),score=19.77 TRINITY_DN2725_c3_g1_i1:54-599(+)